MQNSTRFLRRFLRRLPASSGLFLLGLVALTARGGAQSRPGLRPQLRAAGVESAARQNAPPSSPDPHAVPIPPGYAAVKPQDINVLSPANATITPSTSAVYRITINPPDAAQKYYVCLDYDHTGMDKYITYLPSVSGGTAQTLPCNVLFEAGVTHVDVTLTTDAATPLRLYHLYAYLYNAFKTYPSAPLIVQGAGHRAGLNAKVSAGGQRTPVSVQSSGGSSLPIHIQSANGQPIPISCLVPTDPIQSGIEGFDCTAGVDQLLTGAGSGPQAAGNGEPREHKSPRTEVLVDCSLPQIYRPGKGLKANCKRGSNGWPATLVFKDKRRQTPFRVEYRDGIKPGDSADLQLMFYIVPSNPSDSLNPYLAFTKSIDIITP